MTEPAPTELSAEDQKLVTLARATRGRTGGPEGAAVRDSDGRTYAASTVALPSLQVSALGVCVAMAVSSGVARPGGGGAAQRDQGRSRRSTSTCCATSAAPGVRGPRRRPARHGVVLHEHLTGRASGRPRARPAPRVTTNGRVTVHGSHRSPRDLDVLARASSSTARVGDVAASPGVDRDCASRPLEQLALCRRRAPTPGARARARSTTCGQSAPTRREVMLPTCRDGASGWHRCSSRDQDVEPREAHRCSGPAERAGAGRHCRRPSCRFDGPGGLTTMLPKSARPSAPGSVGKVSGHRESRRRPAASRRDAVEQLMLAPGFPGRARRRPWSSPRARLPRHMVPRSATTTSVPGSAGGRRRVIHGRVTPISQPPSTGCQQLGSNLRRVSEGSAWARHDAAVARLKASYDAIPAGQPVRLAKKTSNLFRPRAKTARPGST